MCPQSTHSPRTVNKVPCICMHCNEPFEVWPAAIRDGSGKYCTKACADAAKVGVSKRQMIACTCPICGTQYEKPASVLRKGEGKYCSKACVGKANGNRTRGVVDPDAHVERTCETCGETFSIPAAWLRKAGGRGRYCSRDCAKAPVGTRTTEKRGYVLVKQADGSWKHEHRIVAEQAAGRPLTSKDHVHHAGDGKDDNRPDKLEVLSPAEHAREHYERNLGHKSWALTPGQWSRDYTACVVCGHIDRPHKRKGRCTRCDSLHEYYQRKQQP